MTMPTLHLRLLGDFSQQDGTCWCGGTTWQGQMAMRINVSSWATSDADVERSLEAMIWVARELA